MIGAGALPPRQQTARLNPKSLAASIALVLASALLIAIAQVWPPAALVALVGLLPLLWAMRLGGLLRIWLLLLLFFCAYFIPSAWWLHAYPGGIGAVLWLSPIYFALPFLLPAAGLALIPAGPLRVLAFPFLWTGFEYLIRLIFLQLNWTILGLPLADYPALSQIAALCGPEGVSFLATAANVVLLCAITLNKRQRMIAITAGVSCFAIVFGAGFLRSTTPEPNDQTLKVGVVQPNVPDEVIWTPPARAPFLNRMTNLVNRTLSDTPDIIVLPEAAINGLVRYDNGLTDFVRSTVIRTHVPLLFGSYDREDNAFYNVAIYIDPHGTVTTYRKIRLAPVVEYQPHFLPYRRPANWAPFSAGTERTVFSTPANRRFSTMICLEDSLPDLARDFARNGAQLLVALVSTRHFLGTAEPLEHLRRAQLSSIAVGLPMVRCANSGISCLISPLGRVKMQLQQGRPLSGVFEASLLNMNTVYRRTGDLPWLIGMLTVGFGIGVASRYFHTNRASSRFLRTRSTGKT